MDDHEDKWDGGVPTDPALRDEGWLWISRMPDEEWLMWLHEPS